MSILLHVRPELKEITRKSLLTPSTRQFYDKIVKLKRDKRRLKRHWSNKKTKCYSQKHYITLNTINSKGKVDNTASVRPQFINMILRNNDVAPQINSKYSDFILE